MGLDLKLVKRALIAPLKIPQIRLLRQQHPGFKGAPRSSPTGLPSWEVCMGVNPSKYRGVSSSVNENLPFQSLYLPKHGLPLIEHLVVYFYQSKYGTIPNKSQHAYPRFVRHKRVKSVGGRLDLAILIFVNCYDAARRSS